MQAPAPAAARPARDLAIVDAKAFERCLSQRPLVRIGAFALHLHRHASIPAATDAAIDRSIAWRLGLVIPKRYEASAVARNTIKRRWRGAFRQGCRSWAAEFGAADLVVRLHAPLAPKGAPLAEAPARVRGRDGFDPQTILGQLTARLRTPVATARPAGSARRPASAVSS